MHLIERNNLLQRLKERLDEASSVDIAVAWVRSGNALEALHEKINKGTKMRIAVGISRNITCPQELRRLQNMPCVELRIPSPLKGIFHPKFFCFHNSKRTLCWVGSANLTQGGFDRNEELVYEFVDSYGEGRDWFDSLWNTLENDVQLQIDAYQHRYESHHSTPKHAAPCLTPLSNISTWQDFVDGLREREKYCRSYLSYSVFGETRRSYLRTISIGRRITRLPNWNNLTKRECNILLGRRDRFGEWGLLGSIYPKGTVAKVFNPKQMPDVGRARERIHDHVRKVIRTAAKEIVPIAHEAVQAIRLDNDLLNDFGPATATRLLTLARPDCLVSVNSKSAVRLGVLAGLKRSGQELRTPRSLAKNYEKLLDWVHKQPWFQIPEPADRWERDIWKCRAALLDVFVYDELNGRLEITR